MSGVFQHNVRNRLLAALSPAVFVVMQPDLKLTELPVRTTLVEADIATSHVYFVEGGLASVVASNSDGDEIEVGLVGIEGMTGIHVVLDVASTSNRTFMQVAGSALRYPVPLLMEILERDAATRNLFLRYTYVCQLQLSQTALANGRFNVHHRLARWLLMCDDRLGTGHIPLTHEFIALMLGIRRSGVTNEIHILEGLHLIRATRGHIQILDREKLKELAGGGYGTPEQEFERLIRPAAVPKVEGPACSASQSLSAA